MDEWQGDLDQETLEKSAKMGEFLPQLKLPIIETGKECSTTLVVKFVEVPKKVVNESFPEGAAFFATVEHNGARMSLLLPKSLRFSLAKEMKIHSLGSIVGNEFVMGAILKDLVAKPGRPARKAVKLYWAQYKKQNVEVIADEVISTEEFV